MLQVEPVKPTDFTLRLRIPTWAKSHSLSVNGNAFHGELENGWVAIHRRWKAGDKVEMNLPMMVERVTLPPQFKQYQNLAALQRGPIVYCLEEQDSSAPLAWLYFPEDTKFTAEHRSDLLGGVTILKGTLPQFTVMYAAEGLVPVMFVPYGVWNNRMPGAMRIWLPARKESVQDLFI